LRPVGKERDIDSTLKIKKKRKRKKKATEIIGRLMRNNLGNQLSTSRMILAVFEIEKKL
jgi:hypothetical protein